MNESVFLCHSSGTFGEGHPIRAADWRAVCTKLRVYPTLVGGLALAFTLLLENPARAQDAIAVSIQPTQDQVLYGKRAPAARNPKRTKKEVAVRPNGAPCLNRRERRARRRLYQEQHRDEFPALHQPGVE